MTLTASLKRWNFTTIDGATGETCTSKCSRLYYRQYLKHLLQCCMETKAQVKVA